MGVEVTVDAGHRAVGRVVGEPDQGLKVAVPFCDRECGKDLVVRYCGGRLSITSRDWRRGLIILPRI